MSDIIDTRKIFQKLFHHRNAYASCTPSQCLHSHMCVYLCVDRRARSAGLPGHRGRPPLRGVLQATSADAPAGGDDTQAGLGSHVSAAPVNRRKAWRSEQRWLSSPCSEICPSVTHDISDTTDQVQKTLMGIGNLGIKLLRMWMTKANWDELLQRVKVRLIFCTMSGDKTSSACMGMKLSHYLYRNEKLR